MDTAKRQAGRWHLSASILIPVVLSLIVVVGVVGGFFYWSSTNSDARAQQRQAQLIGNFFDMDFDQQAIEQSDLSYSDEASASLYEDFDLEAVETYYGTDVFEELGYGAAIVLDANDNPIVVMNKGILVGPEAYDTDRASLAPMVAKARAQIANGDFRAYVAGNTNTLPYVGDVAIIDGAPAMVTIMPIMPWYEDITVTPGQEYLHVLVDYFDEDYAQFVAEQNLVDAPAFRQVPSGSADISSYALFNDAGRIVTFFEWKQDRPGQRMLIETLPALLVALGIAATLIVLLLFRLWRYSIALEEGRLKAQHQAHHDALTGLPNRAYFEESLAKSLSARRSGKPMALFMLDLDRFKQVNDTLGHPAGDELIRQVGTRLQKIVGPAGVVARLGGDEFSIVLDQADEGDCQALATRIIESIAQPFDLFGHEAGVGVSIGMAIDVSRTADRDELMRVADIALYEAKAAGRNRAVLYQERMDLLVRQRHSVEADLRHALRDEGQIAVEFVPVHDQHGEIIGAEAHPTWTHPERGTVPAAQFVPVAETSGLIEPLGEMLLRQACQFGARLPGRVVSVNVSAVQLRNAKFFNRVFDVLADTGMRPADLELQIGEKVLLETNGIAVDALRKFRAAGIRVAVADFGSNYSSLNFLKQAYVGRIKIDASAEAGAAASTITQAIVTLAHAMRVEVTATGISDARQLAVFANLGCNAFQGDYFLSNTALLPSASVA